MKHTFRAAASCALIGLVLFLPAYRAGIPLPEDKDVWQAGAVWHGEIHQDGQVFLATLNLAERNGDKIKGEIQWNFGEVLCKLKFHGKIEGSVVAWITDKKEGPVMAPALYMGRWAGKKLTGTWQVPRTEQSDRFFLSLAE